MYIPFCLRPYLVNYMSILYKNTSKEKIHAFLHFRVFQQSAAGRKKMIQWVQWQEFFKWTMSADSACPCTSTVNQCRLAQEKKIYLYFLWWSLSSSAEHVYMVTTQAEADCCRIRINSTSRAGSPAVQAHSTVNVLGCCCCCCLSWWWWRWWALTALVLADWTLLKCPGSTLLKVHKGVVLII